MTKEKGFQMTSIVDLVRAIGQLWKNISEEDRILMFDVPQIGCKF